MPQEKSAAEAKAAEQEKSAAEAPRSDVARRRMDGTQYQAMSRMQKAEHTRAELGRQDTWEVYVDPQRYGRSKSGEPPVVTLATINGVRYTCRSGESKAVPVEAARIAWEAGIVHGPPPPGADKPLRKLTQVGGAPMIAQRPDRPDMQDPDKAAGARTALGG